MYWLYGFSGKLWEVLFFGKVEELYSGFLLESELARGEGFRIWQISLEITQASEPMKNEFVSRFWRSDQGIVIVAYLWFSSPLKCVETGPVDKLQQYFCRY